jgi:hypothetical protein
MATLALAAGVPAPVRAGPPFETDDPAPTSTHHWEVYLFTDAGGRGAEFDGSSGVDINHGIVPGVQFTVTLPFDVSTSGGGPGVAMGDIDLGLKYRFWSQWSGGWTAAVAPVLTVPIHHDGEAPARVGMRMPLWVGWEGVRWTVYGGGGPSISGDADGRDSFFAGIVLARKLTPDAQLGVEATWHGPEHDGEHSEAGLDLGCMMPVLRNLVLHAAVGPRFTEGESAKYRFYVGLATEF